MNSRILICFLVLTLIFSVSGCATKSTPTFDVKYYPDCYDPIDKLCKDQSHNEEIKSAVVGGLIGAAGGAIVGGLATGNAKGALVGAGAGAAAGALTGFFAGRLNKIEDQKQRLAEYQNILGEKSKGWDLERASVERSYKCYGEQIKLLQRAVKAKKITRDEFKARMNEIHAGIQYINTYWANAQTKMDETLADGDSWLQQEDTAAAKGRKTQAQAQIQRQKRNTDNLRAAQNKANNRTNQIKSQTEAALADLQKYADEDSAFAYLGNWDFVAML